MDLEQVKILLERYNQGLCTPEETELVEQWFNGINQHETSSTGKEELRLQLSDIKSAIDNQLAPQKPVRRMRGWYIAAAAAVLITAVCLFWYNQPTRSVEIAGTPEPAVHIARTTRTVINGSVEIVTPRMVRDTIKLEDGSTIVLNAGSKLRYPEHFSNTERSIWLEEGEAYFDATQQQGRPFVVYTNPLTTTALGTTFNIRTYAAENKVTVALFTGKVKVDHLNTTGNQAGSLVLNPSEQVSFNRLQPALRKTSFAKPEEVYGWKKGHLIFKDASFDELQTGLGNHFGVTVVNQSSKTVWNYTGIFRNESLQDVMETLCIATSLTYSVKKDTVFLVNKH